MPMPERKILFLCTGNYYRSRFAEELFNHLAAEKGLDWRAESRGLYQDFRLLGNFGHMSSLAVTALEKRQVKVSRKRFPQKLKPGEAKGYQIVIALDQDEHQPLIERHYPEMPSVTYWDIKDLGDEPAESALGRIETKIRAFITELSARTATQQIRNAALDDCPGIARVQVDSYRSAYAGQFPAAYLEHFTYAEEEQDWRQLLTSGSEDILLVAASPENQVVGYVLARARPDIYPGYDSEILALHVRKASQGQGIGKALLRGAVERLKVRRCKSTMLWTLKNNQARQWYERLNGELLGEKHYDVDDWEIVEVAYGWENIDDLRS